MKWLILFLMLPLTSFCQKVLLLDRKLEQEVKTTDSVTLDQLSKGLMPIFVRDVSALLVAIDAYKKLIDTGNRLADTVNSVTIGSSHCVTRIETSGGARKHFFIIATDAGVLKTSMTLVRGEKTKTALNRLSVFQDYLKNNMAALH